MFLENKQLLLGSPTGQSLSVSGLPYPTTSFSNTFACFLGLSDTNSHSAIILAVLLSFKLWSTLLCCKTSFVLYLWQLLAAATNEQHWAPGRLFMWLLKGSGATTISVLWQILKYASRVGNWGERVRGKS